MNYQRPYISKQTRSSFPMRRRQTWPFRIIFAVTLALFILPPSLPDRCPGIAPVFAMDTLTEGELSCITAASGIVASASASDAHLKFTFNSLSISEPDEDEWLVIAGYTGTAATTYDPAIINHTIDSGELLILDCATTDSDGLTVDDVYIPPDTTFIASDSLPIVQPDVTVPEYLFMGLGTTSGTIAKTIGMAKFIGVDIQAFDVNRGFLWAHE